MTTTAPPTPPTTSAPAEVRATEGRRRTLPPAVWLIAPSVIFMALLFGWPMIQGILQAFRNSDGFTLEFVRRMVADPYFWTAVRNTLLLIVVLIPLQFVFAVAMALLLRAAPRGKGLYFYLWAIPLAVSDLAAGLVWLAIFTDRGYLNSVLERLGVGGYSWLAYDSQLTMFIAVLLAELWRATSLVLVIVVAGLQGIPKDYDEAAQVFGASAWDRLRHVTLPLLKPSLQVALILRTILAFQTFAVAQALTGQNFPLVVGETYRWYTALQNPGVAAALALVIMFVSMLTSVVYLRVLRESAQGGSK
jgi:multiple sugar transport system permease protein